MQIVQANRWRQRCWGLQLAARLIHNVKWLKCWRPKDKQNNNKQQQQRRRRRVTKNGQSQVKITFQWTKQTQNSANRRRCHRSRPTWPRDIRVSLLAGAQSDALTFASAMASQFATSCLPYDLLCFVNGTARQTDKQTNSQAGSQAGRQQPVNAY